MTGVPARTVNRIWHSHRMPELAELDPMTGIVVRASKTTAVRYAHDRPGSLVHTDVKKLGRIPDGGGWRGRGELVSNHASRPDKRTRVGYDDVHSLVDDHSRYAYSEILPDEQGPTTAGFLDRAILAARGIRHVFIKPHCP